MDRLDDVMIVFHTDGSIRAGWDATTDQLIAIRDTVIPTLIEKNKAKAKPEEFTTYTFPPKE